MEGSILKVENLFHRYSSQWAVQNISFEISQRGILGLLGSNGAGKSTTMNIISGVLNQTSGKVWIDGIDLKKDPEKAKKMIGFLPQVAPLHLELTIEEYLTYCAHLRSIQSNSISLIVSETMERCGINHLSKRIVRNLSGGYRQRVGIAQAIIHKPKLVILDEPTNGLDPNQILVMRRLIKEIGEERAVIFSSHILSEIQATCGNIIMIENGEMIFSNSMAAFNNYIRPYSVIINLETPPSLSDLHAIDRITEVELIDSNWFRLKFVGLPDITKNIIKLSLENNWRLAEIFLEKTSADEIFGQLSRSAKNN
jgi:ABC-2 type transport system ATP-binding protein